VGEVHDIGVDGVQAGGQGFEFYAGEGERRGGGVRVCDCVSAQVYISNCKVERGKLLEIGWVGR
jgi:hypothetical protein